MNNDPIMQVERVHKSYWLGRVEVPVLRGATLSVQPGEFLVVRGASGSGKSTLLHLMGALDVPDLGTVVFEGSQLFRGGPLRRARIRNQRIGFVFQFYHLLPELTVLENVMMPRMVSLSWLGWQVQRGKVREQAEAMLERVGLSHRAKHRPAELSGGERQRVAIGRALMNEPVLLLADEPTGNLDAKTGEGILQLLSELNQAGQTLVMVTHDAEVAARAHRRVELIDGKIEAGDPVPA
jgi:lipoprotein-releasing system ATP-binding protein